MLLSDPSQLNSAGPGPTRTVVVGSGAAGLYAAWELSRRGHDVAVIESGGFDLGGFAAESFTSIGCRHQGIRIGRSRTLGGTTNLWGGQLAEFLPVDFSGRDWLPGSRWPISYEEIAPYYRRTYSSLGIEGEAQEDLPVFRHFLGSRPSFEEGVEIFLTRWLKVPNFGVYYARQIQSSPNLRVLLRHTVVGFSGSGGVIRGVKVVDPRGGAHMIGGDRFILAAGTIEISRLLLHAAGTPDWDCPWRD